MNTRMRLLSAFLTILLPLAPGPDAMAGSRGAGKAGEKSPVDYVDPYIGTQGLGNTFPGATRPFGMVKLGPDCGDLRSNMGYRHDGDVKGFSHLHVSGTGGGCKYGNILVSPFYGTTPPRRLSLRRDSEKAEAGYFSMNLENGTIAAELTATPHAGVHRYTFTTAGPQSLAIDAGSILGADYGFGEQQDLIGSEIDIVSDREITGQQRVSGGWNLGKAFTVYFYAVTDRPFDSFGTWKGQDFKSGLRQRSDSGEPTGAWVTFGDKDNSPIELKVGISFISVGKAKENCLAETSGKTFDDLRGESRDAWNAMLSRINVDSDNDDELKQFYTALYHTMLQPVDKTGENALWKSDAPYYDDFYCLWDTFRTSHPLLLLFTPERQRDIVNSLIDIYLHEGYMPDGRSGDSNGRTQGGSNGDMLVAEAILKDLPGIDTRLALEAMLKDAEVSPGGHQRNEGRGGLEDYKKLGYVSSDFERAGTRTMEYSANDWAIALAAKKLGEDSICAKYTRRASNWENLWRDVEYDGFRGFIMPRRPDRRWDTDYADPSWDYYCTTSPNAMYITPLKEIPADKHSPETFTPSTCGSWCNFFYETNSWEYSFYVPQDMARLIQKCGGKDTFVSRLDEYFDNNRFHIDNEPGFLTPYLYIYAGEHGKTARRVRDILARHYSSAPDGLPGNDDSGAMSSLYIFHKTGFFPVAGQDIYLLGVPSYRNVEIDMGEGKKLRVSAKNMSDKNRYVNGVKINGQPWDKAWFRHSDIKDGATVEFRMGSKPVDWNTGELPPSIHK